MIRLRRIAVCLFFAAVLTPGVFLSAFPSPWLQSFQVENEFYVSPDGNGKGEKEDSPTNPKAAFDSAKPGDLFWFKKGTYTGTYYLKRGGTPEKPVIYRAMPGESVVFDGSFKVLGPHIWIWGFEIKDPDGSATTGAIEMEAPGVHVINNRIHDMRGGIGIGAWDQGAGQVIYGNILYSPKPAKNNPHNLYLQNDFDRYGYKYVVNNILIDAGDATSGTYNVHAYTQGGLLRGLHFEQNVFSNGKFLIGGYNRPADRNVVRNNYFYKSEVRFGHRRPAQVDFRNNYLARSSLFIEWFWGAGDNQFKQTAPNTFTGNTILLPPDKHIHFRTSAYLPGGRCEGCASIRSSDLFDQNIYSSPFRADYFAKNEKKSNLAITEWRDATQHAGKRFDAQSVEVPVPSMTRVTVLRNEYEPGNAHVIVINWQNLPKIRLDLSNVLEPGQAFDLFEIQSGSYSHLLTSTYNEPFVLPISAAKEFSTYVVAAKN